ncbi:MAG: Uma2 family endonuclease [Terricaulis sp.]
MPDTQRRRWTADEFLAWEAKQEAWHEFVDGQVRAMVGATRAHNRISANVLAHLHGRLKGSKCQPFGPDMKIVTPSGNVRFADVVIDCGVGKPTDLAADEPSVVVEVLSKSTAWADQTQKLDDYQAIPTMRHILHLAQERAEGELWTREVDGWRRAPFSGLETEVSFTAIGVTLPLSAAYEGVPFEEEAEAP